MLNPQTENQVSARMPPGRLVSMPAPFTPGLELAGAFFAEVVRPLLDQAYPRLPYAAALPGPGSEVLGYDTARSADHDWGPRLQLLPAAGDAGRPAAEITAMLADRLPPTFRGYPTTFPVTRDGVARHRVEVSGLGEWLAWPGVRPPAARHRGGLAGDAHAAARRGHRREGVPRRSR